MELALMVPAMFPLNGSAPHPYTEPMMKLVPATFDPQEAGVHLTGILKRQVESECSYSWNGEKMFASLSTQALWITAELLYIVIKIETLNGSALAGYETGLITNKVDQFPYSFEVLNAQQFWSSFLAGDYFMGKVDFGHSDLITWILVEDETIVPHTWSELLGMDQQSVRMWIHDDSRP